MRCKTVVLHLAFTLSLACTQEFGSLQLANNRSATLLSLQIGQFTDSTAVTTTGFTLHWTESLGSEKQETASLEYCLCKGASLEDVRSLDHCKQQSDIAADCQRGLLTKSISGLVPDTSYFYNVRVIDRSNNTEQLYGGKEQRTLKPDTSERVTIQPTPDPVPQPQPEPETDPDANTVVDDQPPVNTAPTLSLDNLASPVVLQGGSVIIPWSATDLEADALVSLYYAPSNIQCSDDQLSNWTLITSGLPSAVGSYSWTTTAAPLGAIYICGRISDGVTGDVFAVGSHPLTIVTAPLATSVTTDHADGAYTVGENVIIKVTFDQSVTVADGTPSILMATGQTERPATYISGSPGTELSFSYIVQAGDSSSDLDLSPSQILLNGSSLYLTGTQIAANLDLPAGSLASSSAIVIDTLAPVIETPTLLSETQDITTKTVRVRWAAASDNHTSASNLQYKLVYSESDNISTLIQANTNGIVVQDFNTAISQATKTALTPNTTYTFNLIVRDSAGNESIYNKINVSTENYCGGIGTSGSPYQICTLGDLHSIRDNLSAYFVLNNDIDASPTSTWNGGLGWDPIGDSTPAEANFKGALDGKFKVIRGLYINRPNEDYVGLIGFSGSTLPYFRNLGALNANVTGRDYTGIIAGLLTFAHSAPRYLYGSGTVQARNLSGCLLGRSQSLEFSFATCDFSGAGGGISSVAGSNQSFLYWTGQSQATGGTGGISQAVQGPATFMHSKGIIRTDQVIYHLAGTAAQLQNQLSYALSEVDIYIPDATPLNTSNQRVGGIAGWVAGANTISHSIATGHLYSRYYTGGISGLNSTGTIEHSLYTGKNNALSGERGGIAGNTQTIVTNTFYDSRNASLGCGSSSATNCNTVSTGTTRPFSFGLAKELEYVEQAYRESPSIVLRKISAQDKSAYRLWGRCTIQNATINLTATDGSTTVNDSAVCKSYNWSKHLNLSSLAEGPVTVTVDQAGSFSKTLHLTKQADFCDENPSNGDFAGGDGTSDTPYLICTTAHFNKLRNHLAANTYFRFMNSIDLSNGDFSGPIGSNTNADCSSRFCGIVQGNGFVVKNTYIVDPTSDHVGVFAVTDDVNARIERLGFENLNVIGQLKVGGLIGTAYNIALDHIYAEGHVMANATASHRVGGVIGESLGKLTALDSFADVTVMVRSSESGHVGGMFGKSGNFSSKPVMVQRNRSDGHVMVESVSTAPKSFSIGGFAGYVEDGNQWSSNISTGHIIAQTDDDDAIIGGFFGRAHLVAENNLSSGSILTKINRNSNAVGGFIGMLSATNKSISKTYSSGHIIQSGATAETGIGKLIGELRYALNGKVDKSVSFGAHLTSAASVGSVAGFIENQAGNQIVDSYFWEHALNDDACIVEDLNTSDADTCNDPGTGLNYATFSNFTSATAVYAAWDFTNTWTFPTGGGLPILKWMYEP